MKKGVKILIAAGSTLAVVGVIVLIGRAHRAKLLADINAQLDKDAGSTKTIAAVQAALDPSFFKTYYITDSGDDLAKKDLSQIILTKDTGLQAAKIFNDAHNFLLPNDQNAMVKEMTGLKTKSNISYVAYLFQKQYGQSLLTFLNTNLSDDNKNLLNSTISNFPNS